MGIFSTIVQCETVQESYPWIEVEFLNPPSPSFLLSYIIRQSWLESSFVWLKQGSDYQWHLSSARYHRSKLKLFALCKCKKTHHAIFIPMSFSQRCHCRFQSFHLCVTKNSGWNWIYHFLAFHIIKVFLAMCSFLDYSQGLFLGCLCILWIFRIVS